MVDKKVIDVRPIEDSANGKTNAYSHCCMTVGHYRSYATCLHLIKERATSKVQTLYPECSAAIGKNRCPSQAMRKEETAAGHAIYFQERIKQGESIIGAVSTFVKSVVKPVILGKSPITESKSMQPDMGGYADAINNAVKSKTAVEAPKLAVGETLIEMAKRMMLAKG
jgi:hypothetical protein